MKVITCLKKTLLSLCLLVMSLTGFSQSIPVGSWRVHLPYSRGISVAASKDLVYCITESSMFSYHKRDFSITPMSKNTGLSDAGFSRIAWHKPTQTLIIAYSNANIDLLRDGKIYNMPDIKRLLLPIDKTINRITFRGDEAWLSCGFGIVVLDMKKREFKQTYQIGPGGTYLKVNDVKFYRDTVYAATDSGIFRAAFSDYLPDYGNWHKWNDLPVDPSPCNTLAFLKDIPFVSITGSGGLPDKVYYRENNVWLRHDSVYLKKCHQLDVIDNKIIITLLDNVRVLDTNLTIYRDIFDYQAGQPKPAYIAPSETTMDDEGYLWIADQSIGLAFIYDQWAYNLITPNGPRTTKVFNMDASDGQVWVVPGAYNSTWTMDFNRDGIYHFNGMEWKTTHYNTEPFIDTVFDLVCIAIDPSDPSVVYAGSWGQGLLVLKNGKPVKLYDQTNSTLQVPENTVSPYFRVPLGGLAFDDKGNLWMSNAYTEKSLSVMKPDGNWYSYNISSPGNKMDDKASGKIVIDRIGQKWVLVGRGYGIQVFSDNKTLWNTSDDQSTNINGNIGQGGLPSTLVTDIEIDLDGRLWIGSDKGIAIIYAPENVFSGYSYDAQRILVNQDGYDQYLLENETVTTIAVDGANRKWIGTEKSGVFLLSPDGTSEIARFHEGNSPLLSNGIRNIVIDDLSGEVFFGTDKGIVSYRSDAIKAGETHSNVTVFPNPVKPGYSGVISITGLVRDADVKIRNMGGDVVYSTRSNGGMAVWNGKDLSGATVATGVYMVFSSDESGTETAVTKILFIR